MRYLSYGHEFIITLVLLLVLSHIILDLLPLWYRHLREAFDAAPITTSGRFLLIVFALFLM